MKKVKKQNVIPMNVAPLIERLKRDIKESKKYEKKYAGKGEYEKAIEEVNNQENFGYFLDLIINGIEE